MAKGKGGAPAQKKTGLNPDRKNGKAFKKTPKVFDPEKRKLVNKQ